MKFGQRVKDLRQQHGWQVVALARRVEVPRQTLNYIEIGASPYTGRPPKVAVDTLLKLAAAFGLTLAELFEGVDDV